MDVNLAKKPLERKTAPPITPRTPRLFCFSRVSSSFRELRFYPDLIEGQQIKVETSVQSGRRGTSVEVI